eukprot:Lithocolla_globosa_v1_NODE_928_length_3073_cov_1148.102386.p2 type:complete len:193 gc:universal NODE_928_length_3073_cov_1148.102386:649-71(-)
MGCARTCLFILNGLFLLLGIGTLAGGIYFLVEGAKYDISSSLAIGTIVLGTVVFFVSFVGFFGAWKRSKCWLYIYIAITGFTLVCQIVVGALAFTYADQAQDLVEEAWGELSESIKDQIYEDFECCGLNNETPPAAGECNTTLDYCQDALVEFVEKNLKYVGGAAIAVMCIQFFALVCGCMLVCDKEEMEKE